MFTGIVQGLGKVVDAQVSDCMRLAVDLGPHTQNLQIGNSVAVNGACLTVTSVGADNAQLEQATHFDVIAETLSLTNLGRLQPGDQVNIERSMTMGDEVGGHLLSGHIATQVQVGLTDPDRPSRLWFECPEQVMKYLFHKGFVALDGASLTISSVDIAKKIFSVDLIPETRARTTLGKVTSGDAVNLEVDTRTQTIVDTLERLMLDAGWLEAFQARLTAKAVP